MTDEQNNILKLLCDKRVARKCYVYFLLNDSNEVVYIGKSTNVISRIATHINKQIISFCDYKVIEVDEVELNKMERRMIEMYLPFYNDDLLTRKIKRSKMLERLQLSDHGLSPKTIKELRRTLVSPGSCHNSFEKDEYIKSFERYLLGN